jgi:hypothetical protein
MVEWPGREYVRGGRPGLFPFLLCYCFVYRCVRVVQRSGNVGTRDGGGEGEVDGKDEFQEKNEKNDDGRSKKGGGAIFRLTALLSGTVVTYYLRVLGTVIEPTYR